MRQLFIIGNPRSGTSLLRAMLNNHSNIVVPLESHFFLWLEEKYQDLNYPLREDDLESFLKDLQNSRKFETWKLPNSIIKRAIDEQKPESYADLIELVYILYGNKNGKENIKYWGDKNKLWKEKLHKIIEYYPEARFIHIVRDGRDVAVSFKSLKNDKSKSKYYPNLPSEIDDIAERWKTNINFIQRFLRLINRDQYITIRYEDLVFDSENTLRKITSFLGLNFENQMVNYHKVKSFDELEPKEFKSWKGKLEQEPLKSNVGKYENKLSKAEISTFEQRCRKELLDYQYISE